VSCLALASITIETLILETRHCPFTMSVAVDVEKDFLVDRSAFFQELRHRSVPELQEMGRRLALGCGHLGATHLELLSEQEELQDEGQQIQATIEMVMQDMKKLNIGADNTVEPVLDEGPLDFVVRYWDMMRPRNNTVVVDDHIGELSPSTRSLLQGEDSDEDGWRERLRGLAETRFAEIAGTLEEIKEKFLPSETAAQNVDGERKGMVTAAMNFRTAAAPLWTQMQRNREMNMKFVGRVFSGGGSDNEVDEIGRAVAFAATHGSEISKMPPVLHAESLQPVLSRELASEPPQISQFTRSPPLAQATEAEHEPPQSSVSGQPVFGPFLVAVSASGPTADVASNRANSPPSESDDEAISATVLIEAMIKIDDGSKKPLLVKATDRPKDVAQQFVREHSLKQWFEDPLTKFLKKTEADAEVFPVRVEADLLELRKLHSRKSASCD